MTFAKVKEESIEVKEPLDPNNGYNIDEEYDKLVAEQAEKDAKYQDVIDYIIDSELMSIKKLNGEDLDTTQLQTWEEKFGKIYISKITDDPVVYIWKPLFRLEYIKLIGTTEHDAECNWTNDASRQQAILKKCLLFPEASPEFISRSRAGIISTLESQIMYQSGFISEQQAIDSINVIG